jgi:hypothetical protein
MRELAEQARAHRVRRNVAGYKSAATELLRQLEKVNALPCGAQQVTLYSKGNVNYLTGRFTSDGVTYFLKVCPPGIETLYYLEAHQGNIITEGNSFVTPKCYGLRHSNDIAIIALQHLHGFRVGETQADQITRARGLGEFAYLNAFAPCLKLLPVHRLCIRRTSIDRMRDILHLQEDSPEITAQADIISRWPVVEQRLRTVKKSLCVRDSSEDNVVLYETVTAIIDPGAVHYAPIGFDIWGLIATSDSPLRAARALSVAFLTDAERHRLKVYPNDLEFVALAAACIMCLDVFVGNSFYGNLSMVRRFQSIASDLINASLTPTPATPTDNL